MPYYNRIAFNYASSPSAVDGLSRTVRGLSKHGASEFLAAKLVTGPVDRRLLAISLLEKMGFTTTGQTANAALLLPAVQAAREAAKKISPRFELTSAGALQFFSGNCVSNPQDRIALAAAGAGYWDYQLTTRGDGP